MAYKDKITTSLRGHRFGLQQLSSSQSGGSRGMLEFLVGPDGFRSEATTADTTGVNLKPFGVHMLTSGTSSVYTLDPPIPGVSVTVMGSTSGPTIIKTANNETVVTTAGSSWTTIEITSLGGSFTLDSATTAVWAGPGITTGTSSQASGFGLTTST